ncbi:MAG: succinylglutamate desuccinylase/aspartoacylase family protein [Bacteroidota bacterium]
MIINPSEHTSATRAFPRVIGHLKADAPGPTLVAIGGMHGNEPSGVYALQRLVDRLERESLLQKGEFIALTGNIRALENGQRFIDTDLNRMWKFRPDLRGLAEVPEVYEAGEMEELQDHVDRAIEQRRGPLVFLDLHTTSAPSPPFILIGDTLRNRRFVQNLNLPVILGLEEQLNGPFLSYLNTKGHISMGFEAGQHEDEVSVENHYSLLLLILVQTGLLGAKDLPDLAANRKRLAGQTTAALKNFFEVRFRKPVHEGERFRMKPGYRNFQPIQKDEALAHNQNGEVHAKERGRIFMPLYQEQGDDGFFIIRRIAPFWLGFSVFLRYLRAHRALPILPGIRRVPGKDGLLIIHTNIVRWFGAQVLHLLGYRRRSHHEGKLLFIKREFDLHGPTSIDKFSE